MLYPFPVGDLMSSNHKNPNFNMKIVFDKKLDDHGMAKVTTAQLKTEHLGNVWSPRASELASELLIENRIHRISTNFEFGWKYKLIFKILNVSFVNKIARGLYDKLFYVFGMKTLYDRLNKK